MREDAVHQREMDPPALCSQLHDDYINVSDTETDIRRRQLVFLKKERCRGLLTLLSPRSLFDFTSHGVIGPYETA